MHFCEQSIYVVLQIVLISKTMDCNLQIVLIQINKTMDSQKAEDFPGPGSEIMERERVAKERAAQRIPSWTVQNEISGVSKRKIVDTS